MSKCKKNLDSNNSLNQYESVGLTEVVSKQLSVFRPLHFRPLGCISDPVRLLRPKREVVCGENQARERSEILIHEFSLLLVLSAFPFNWLSKLGSN